MSNPPNGTQAVDRAARLLSEVVHASHPVTFTELTAATGLARSTTSRLLLAYGAAQLPKGPLQRCTERTITMEPALRAELATVRARGYAVTDEELEPGLIALAAPVFRYDGTVVAAMSVSAPTSRMTREAVTNAARRCVEEAVGLSSALGYRPRPRPHTARSATRTRRGSGQGVKA